MKEKICRCRCREWTWGDTRGRRGRAGWQRLFVAELQSCVWLFYDPVKCCPLGSPVHGIFQLRILEQVALFFSRGSSRPRDGTRVSCIGRRVLYHGATIEALNSLILKNKMFYCLYCFLLVLQTLSTVWRCLFCLIMDYLVKQKKLVFFHDYFQCYVSGILCRCYSLFISLFNNFIKTLFIYKNEYIYNYTYMSLLNLCFALQWSFLQCSSPVLRW